MKPEHIDSLFYKISRYIILVPILIIGVAVFLRSQQGTVKSSQQLASKPNPTVVPLPSQSQSNQTVNLDLSGPYACIYQKNNNTYKAYVKNKNVYIESKDKNNFLLNGDCVYEWKSSIPSGEKTCGVSGFVSMIDMLSKTGLMSLDSMVSMMKENGFLGKDTNIDTQAIVKSCKKEDFSNDVFQIPQSVIFKEQKLQPSSKP